MATGDLEGNLLRLNRELDKARYRGLVDEEGLRTGASAAFVPLLRHVLLSAHKELAALVVERECTLATAQTDRRFVEGVWRFARNTLGYRPALSVEQFLSPGFAERKLLLTADIARLCRAKQAELAPRQRPPSTTRQQHQQHQPEYAEDAGVAAEIIAAQRFGSQLPSRREEVPVAAVHPFVREMERSALVAVVDGLRGAVDALAQRIAALEREQQQLISIQSTEDQLAALAERVATLEERFAALVLVQQQQQQQQQRPPLQQQQQQQQQQPPLQQQSVVNADEDTEQFIARISQRWQETRQQISSSVSKH